MITVEPKSLPFWFTWTETIFPLMTGVAVVISEKSDSSLFLPLISIDIGGSWKMCSPNPSSVKLMNDVRSLLSDNLKESSSNFSTKYWLLFVSPPIADSVEEYLTVSKLLNPWDFILIVSVNVLIPVLVCTSLFLKNPESSTSILSTFSLLSTVLSLCIPPPFVVIGIVPIPARASSLLSASDIMVLGFLLTTK